MLIYGVRYNVSFGMVRTFGAWWRGLIVYICVVEVGGWVTSVLKGIGTVLPPNLS